VLGYGASNDAHHMAQPEPEATGRRADDARRAPPRRRRAERVGYINAHGTSTPLGDAAETRRSSRSSATTRTSSPSRRRSRDRPRFGAAGAIEAIMCVARAARRRPPADDQLPQPDPECDLDYVPNEAREAQVDVALSNAMGLGGSRTAACSHRCWV
jgi:3-oxoacyl-[acyl-carrier-protein] synthase II